MDELANKILDLLREENITMISAKFTLERAIQLLGFERLGPKKEELEGKK